MPRSKKNSKSVVFKFVGLHSLISIKELKVRLDCLTEKNIKTELNSLTELAPFYERHLEPYSQSSLSKFLDNYVA